MRIAAYHNLPRAGGAQTVLAEVVKRLPRHDWSLYTLGTGDGEDLVGLDSLFASRTVHPLPAGEGVLAQYRRMLALPSNGMRLARKIDAGGHDVVFALPSMLVQAPEILPCLRTPSVYYAPEPLRAAYDATPTLRMRVSPYTRSRLRQDRRNLAAADVVMTHSQFTAERLREVYGIDPHIVALGVDTDRLRPGAPVRRREILSVGALDPVKGHAFVIDAAAALQDRSISVAIIGDRGEDGPALEAHARSRGVRLEILRAVPFEEVIARYQNAGVVACAAHGEPFGLSPLEAMATATPVVAVNEGGYRETVRDGIDGLLTSREVQTFAGALRRVIDDSELAGTLGRAGRLAAERRWNWQHTADRVEELLLNSARGRVE